ITQLRCVYVASASRDFSPQHVDPVYARERARADDVFVSTPFVIGMVSRFLSDWGGPHTAVRRLTLSMQKNICAGDDMILSGTVTAKRHTAQSSAIEVTVTISTDAGEAMRAEAVIDLPLR